VVSIRLRDDAGRVWGQVDKVIVSLDRRYVYRLQPPASTVAPRSPRQSNASVFDIIVSGTVKRVGLDYVWARM
jgi:hypothetical protein